MSFKTPTFKAESLTAYHKSKRVPLSSLLMADIYSLSLTQKSLIKRKKKKQPNYNTTRFGFYIYVHTTVSE